MGSGAGATLSAAVKLVLSAAKGENDAIDVPQVFGMGKLVVQQSREIFLGGSAKRDERLPKQRI